ncbi:cysO-cysteine peptidase [alpha proteobacterium Q-1]|nr:cysO-cysteine peptidase [alpha proteobacterium Q-1]
MGWRQSRLVMNHLQLGSHLLAQIEDAARAAAPAECCGLLIGVGRRVTRAVASANKAVEPNRFELDAGVHLRWQRDLRGRDEQIIGIYHSHPGGLARPSSTDLAAAIYPGWIWLITALSSNPAKKAGVAAAMGQAACVTTAWLHRPGGSFEPVEISLIDGNSD